MEDDFMSAHIVLFNKTRKKLGIINFNEENKELSFDWDQKYPEEISDAVKTILQSAYNDKGVKVLREVVVEKEEGIVHMQKIENVSFDDPQFLAALADNLNRSAALKTKVFAVLQKK